MHSNVKDALIKWRYSYDSKMIGAKIADIGSRDINGAVREVIPQVVGFDIVDGDGVDVKINPGAIPTDHMGIYDFVTSISSFQTCPDSSAYKKEIVDLLKVDGMLLLTMCADSCKIKHSTSPNSYGYEDGVRMDMGELIEFFKPEVSYIKCFGKKGKTR